ncbi:MAG: exo-alpha-sialidase [Acidimicrobiia bacterium]|nr:exo-alpha-sialidase [Acidimicrobiia bacterium]
MTTIGIGTEKGGFVLRDATDGWRVDGPLFPGWKVTTWSGTPEGHYLAALASNWFGPAIHRSPDLVEWEQIPSGPSYEGESPKLNQIWTIHIHGDTLLAGVDEAGLFRSHDDGLTWEPVPALNDFSGRSEWFPGLGGLCAHHILTAGDSIWVGISAVGVFRSDDGGASFRRCDRGISGVDGGEADAYCVHGIVADPDDPDHIWRQDHSGVYVSEDGAESWERIEEGLPSNFGFPVARDAKSGRVFVVPLEADTNRLPVNGALRAYFSEDGRTWQPSGEGWDDAATYTTVLRGAMHTDGLGGIYFGTTGGDVWASLDSGDHWAKIPHSFPRILSVRVLG